MTSDNKYQNSNDSNYNDNYQDTTNSGNNNSNNANSSVKGTYTREVFSGNTFDYITNYNAVIFTFNGDSTFEIYYDNWNTYKGDYEIYNEL